MGVKDNQNILQRALSYGRRAIARSIASDPQAVKALSINNPTLARIFSGYFDGDDEKLTDPYSQIATVYACNRVISSNIAQVPYRLYPRGSEEPIESGPLYDLYHSPNPYMTGRQMWTAIATLLGIVGYAPVFKDPETVNNVPVALWPKHPKHTTVVRNGNDVFVGWNLMLQGNVLFFPRDEVVVPKYWNPNDEILGMSPIEALNLSLQSEWGAIRYNRQFFEQGQVPGAVFSTDQMLDQESFKQLKHELIDTRAGADKAHKAMLLHGGLKLAAERPSNRDLEFLELRKFTRDDVTMVYRVPKSEISLYEDTNYATATSADLGFWKKTLIPIMRLIEDYFDIGINNALGFQGKFDLESVDVLNAEVLKKAESAEKFVRMGVPFSVVNDRLGLGFPEFDGDSVPLYGNGLQATEEVVQESVTEKAIPIVGDPEPETVVEGYDVTKELRTAKWKSLMNEVNPLMGRANREIKDWFFDIQQQILKAVVKYVDGQTVTKAEQLSDFEWIDRYFSDAAFRDLMSPLFREAVGVGADSIRFAIGQIPEERIQLAVNQRFEKLTGVVENARETVLRYLRGALSQAIESGATEEERAQMIVDAVKSSMKINSNRARTIARTEMHTAYAVGRHEKAIETEPSHKTWISSRDDRVREAHVHLEGERVPFDQEYSNGLMFPLDPNGPADEVISCRCVEVYDYENE